jgi:hypothetical protein
MQHSMGGLVVFTNPTDHRRYQLGGPAVIPSRHPDQPRDGGPVQRERQGHDLDVVEVFHGVLCHDPIGISFS